jgi:NADH:ubiquinone oxidoreductase subunit 2 (subunit N)
MALLLIFILPLIAALACLGLSWVTPTRWLGVGAAGALLIGGAALLVAKSRVGLPLALLDRAWIAIDNRPIRVLLQFDTLSWVPALLALFGGGVALLALALMLPFNLRGFGGLFGAAQLAILATVAGLANQNLLLLPFAWSLAALSTFLALRASGALTGSDAPVIVLLAGLSGALIALGMALLMPPAASGASLARSELVGWVLLGLLALGTPPFHAPLQRLAEAPAALSGMLMTLGLPLLGGVALIRIFGGQAVSLPTSWRSVVTVLGIGTLLVCAAGAAGATLLRRLLSWQFSAQMGLVLLALAQSGSVRAVAAPALLANGVLSTLVCYVAVAILERRAGTDDLAGIVLREPLIWPGALFLIGAASAIGLPGFWGFWPRRWLLDELLRATPWAIAPLLAGSTLLALAFLPALAIFWRRTGASPIDERVAPRRERPAAVVVVGAIGAIPLLVFGVAPAPAWNGWLSGATGVAAPALPGGVAQAVCGVAALLLTATPVVMLLSRSSTHTAAPVDSVGVSMPAALGESLAWLARLGTATSAFAGVWHGILSGSRFLLRGLQLLEQRYYLAGLLIAVIVVIMLFIQ